MLVSPSGCKSQLALHPSNLRQAVASAGLLCTGDATAMLDVCLFVGVSKLAQVDSSSDGLLQALKSVLSTDMSVQLFTKAHNADPTGFAQLSFQLPHDKVHCSC